MNSNIRFSFIIIVIAIIVMSYCYVASALLHLRCFSVLERIASAFANYAKGQKRLDISVFFFFFNSLLAEWWGTNYDVDLKFTKTTTSMMSGGSISHECVAQRRGCQVQWINWKAEKEERERANALRNCHTDGSTLLMIRFSYALTTISSWFSCHRKRSRVIEIIIFHFHFIRMNFFKIISVRLPSICQSVLQPILFHATPIPLYTVHFNIRIMIQCCTVAAFNLVIQIHTMHSCTKFETFTETTRNNGEKGKTYSSVTSFGRRRRWGAEWEWRKIARSGSIPLHTPS